MRSDHFSRQAAGYATFRPSYPDALFAYLASVAPDRERAWDCATGNGQAALGLAAHFDTVVATDGSASQVAHALPHPRVEYRVATAEASGLPDASVALVAVAQAAHWFDLDAFHAEARRVLVPGGVVALWCYGSAWLDEAALSAAFAEFEHETLAPYWPPERQLIVDAYRTIPFPLRELDAPAFALRQRWTLPEVLGYVRTWSGVARAFEETGEDFTGRLERRLAPLWGAPDRDRWIEWPVALRVGVSDAGAVRPGDARRQSAGVRSSGSSRMNVAPSPSSL